MHIPARILHAGTFEVSHVEFECTRCGHRATAEVKAYGHGMATAWVAGPEVAERHAAVDARANAKRTLRTARCPSCHRRRPGALLAFWSPLAILVVSAIAAGFGFAYLPAVIGLTIHDDGMLHWLMPVLLGGSALLVVAIEGPMRWSRLDKRVRWIDD